MPSVIQRGFSAGEISPAMSFRADLEKYRGGLKTMRNCITRKDGAATNRAGTEFCVSDESDYPRVIPFIFSQDQAYVLQFRDEALQIILDGAHVGYGTPAAYAGGTTYAIGDQVTSVGIVYYSRQDGNIGHTPASSIAYWWPMPTGILEIPTPYEEEDLAAMQFVQSADVMTITHNDFQTMELRRVSATIWTLTAVEFNPVTEAPQDGVATAGGAGSTWARYRVTTLGPDGIKESLPGYERTKVISAATQANPCAITANSHGYITGDEVWITGIVGMTQLNDRLYTITQTGANSFTLDGVDSTAYTAYGSAGTSARTFIGVLAAVPTSAAPITLAWDAVADASRYVVYKESQGVFGFVGYAAAPALPTFSDANIIPDTADSHPIEQDLFTNNYPACVAYAQQRLVFANTDARPEGVDASRVGDFHNFTKSSPTKDGDAMAFVMAGQQVNEVRSMIEVGQLLILTAAGVFAVQGDDAGVLKPSAPNVRQKSYFGASTLRPLVVGDSLLYVQTHGGIIRDLRYSFSDDGYKGNDLTAYASHLLAGRTVVDWAYQQSPHSIIWAVLDDGSLIACTYIREQEILAWHRHDTGDGLVKSVCVIPENDADVLYLVVERTINGATDRYIERMKSRQFTDQDDAWFVDSGLAYDGNYDVLTLGLTQHLTLSGSGWTPNDNLTLTANIATFTAGDVGNDFVLRRTALAGYDGEVEVWCRVVGYTSPTVVTVRPDIDVPVTLQASLTAEWAEAVDQVSGLDHLEGERVSVYADGSVISDGSDDTYVVTAGVIDLPRPFIRILVGLPITADLEMLDIEDPEAETFADKRLLINQATLMVESSAVFAVGIDADNPRTIKGPAPAALGDPTPLTTGKFNIGLNSSWNDNGRVFIRNTNPTPMTILGIVRRGKVEKAPG